MVRISDGVKRRDFCKTHGAITVFQYRDHDNVVILDCWNGVTIQNFEEALEQALIESGLKEAPKEEEKADA